MSSKSVIRSKLKKCQLDFNEAYKHGTASIKRLQEERDELLLQLLGPIGGKDQLHKLFLIYYDLMLKAQRENNNNEATYYKSKVAEVKNTLLSSKDE